MARVRAAPTARQSAGPGPRPAGRRTPAARSANGGPPGRDDLQRRLGNQGTLDLMSRAAAPPATSAAPPVQSRPALAEARLPEPALALVAAPAPEAAADAAAPTASAPTAPAPTAAAPTAAATGDAAPTRESEAPAPPALEGPAPLDLAAEAGEAEAPAPEAGPSPEVAVASAVKAVRGRAAGQAVHPPAEAPAGNAQASAQDPLTEQQRLAAQATLEQIDAAESNPVDRVSFEAALTAAITAAVPKKPRSKDQAKRLMRDGAADASSRLAGQVDVESDKAAGPVASAAAPEAAVTPAAVAGTPGLPREAVPLEVVEPGAAPEQVGAGPLVPEMRPPSATDYSANRSDADALLAEEGIEDVDLAESNEPEFTALAGERQAATAQDEASAESFRGGEAGQRATARSSGQSLIDQGLATFFGARAEQMTAVAGEQHATQDKDAAKRAQITKLIDDIKKQTQADVQTILQAMRKDALNSFNQGLGRAETAFEEVFESRTGWWDRVWSSDWKQEVADAFTKAHAAYTRVVKTAISDVAGIVDRGLRDAKDRVAKGRADVDDFVETLDGDLRQHGEEARDSIAGDFAAMEGEIEAAEGALVQDMVGAYKASQDRLAALEERLREDSKSLWDRIKDATIGVVNRILEFKDMLLGILGRAADVVTAIIKAPIRFLGNLITGIKAGLDRFMGNALEHLKKGLFGWLFGALEGAGLTLPSEWDFKGILSIVLQVLGLTYANIRKRAVGILGEEMVSRLELVAEIFTVLKDEGPAGLWRMLMEKLGEIKDTVLAAIRSFVMEQIIKGGIIWIVSLLNPASALIKACKAIYDIVLFFIERGRQLIDFVNAIINSLAVIVAGKTDVMAKAVEDALARALPVAISFLASLLNLGGISDKIREIIEKIQEPVNKAIDWVITKAVELVKKAGQLLFGGKKEDKETPEAADPETQAQIDAGLMTLREKNTAVLENGALSVEEAEGVAAATKVAHPVFKSITVVQKGDKLSYAWKANPEADEPAGDAEDGGPVRIETITVKNPNEQEKIRKAAHTSGREFEQAIGSKLIKRDLVLELENEYGQPVVLAQNVGKGQVGRTDYQQKSRPDLIRFKWQRGHRGAGQLRRPEGSAEIFGADPTGKITRLAMVLVEITLVSDFGRKDTTAANAKFSMHKVSQFQGTIEVLKEKFGTELPITYYFYSDKELAPETRTFIEAVLEMHKMPNVTIVWRTVSLT
jgi:hypothetical protein